MTGDTDDGDIRTIISGLTVNRTGSMTTFQLSQMVFTATSHAKSLPAEPALLLKVEDAARLLGVGRTTLFELIGEGRIQTVRLGRRRLVVRAGLERFVEEISA